MENFYKLLRKDTQLSSLNRLVPLSSQNNERNSDPIIKEEKLSDFDPLPGQVTDSIQAQKKDVSFAWFTNNEKEGEISPAKLPLFPKKPNVFEEFNRDEEESQKNREKNINKQIDQLIIERLYGKGLNDLAFDDDSG